MLLHPSTIAALVPRIAVVGGGASGMSAAIAAASTKKNKVVVFEGSGKTLAKVKISGGGRCNVLHDTTKSIPEILDGYPRGQKELLGIWNKQFTPTQAREWFQKRGVELKTESDGRMFPVTDSSQTIIDVFVQDAKKMGVDVRLKEKVLRICQPSDSDHCFALDIKQEKDTRQEAFDAFILATGSSPAGYQMAHELGHDIVKPVPSLFTLNAKHQIKEGQVLHGLSGVSVQKAKLTFKYPLDGRKKKQTLVQEGPLLITHHGLSGPATLRLSSLVLEYCMMSITGVTFLYIGHQSWERQKKLQKLCGKSPRPHRNVQYHPHVLYESPHKDATWGNAKKKSVRALARVVGEFVVDVTGKGVFKEKFVKAGGISLKDMEMKTMQSKRCEGLFFCGEIINVDGITGGFNFMNCWSTGYVAGTAAAKHVSKVASS